MTESQIISKTIQSVGCLLLTLLLTCVPGMGTTYTMTSDRTAYAKALNLSDPQAKIEALRLFRKSYPKSMWADYADDAILQTLIKKFPDRSDAINNQVNEMLKPAHGDDRMYEYDGVASTLTEGNVLLPRAEKLSLKSLHMLKRKTYVANLQKQVAKAKMNPLTDAELDSYYRRLHSSLQGTLGRVYVREGKMAPGKSLLEAAYREYPGNSEAAASLGMLAAQEGKKAEALGFLTKARLMGKLDDAQEKQLEKTYLATHAGSSEKLDAYLDNRYLALFPPFEAPKYSAAAPTDRTVLAELFTGSGCPPCAGADLAIDGELERYSRKELAVLVFEQHIPEPDPMTIPASVERFKFYQCTGTPTLAIDGSQAGFVGGDRADAQKTFSQINQLVDKALDVAPTAQIKLTVSRSGAMVKVHAEAADIKGSLNNLRLQIVLVGNKLHYSGENGIRLHSMVVRNMAGNDGFAVAPGKSNSFQYSFDMSKISADLKTYLDEYQKSNDRFGPITFTREMYEIDPNDLSVVAFLQDSQTKRVLQAAYRSVPSAR